MGPCPHLTHKSEVARQACPAIRESTITKDAISIKTRAAILQKNPKQTASVNEHTVCYANIDEVDLGFGAHVTRQTP
ncbi:MAG: hypothetical protein DME33_01035 [Verrucomicrobia bacterium]|nr:MAG: hypothetical protein DME33_01035 [Verrucomicrobiota bacterium]